MSTATEGLEKFLGENLMDPSFDEFSPTYKFLVTQFSTLICSDNYNIDKDNKEVNLDDNLFKAVVVEDEGTSVKLENFKKSLKAKMKMDLTVRKERRNSIGHGRARSDSIKRASEDSNTDKSKICRTSNSSQLPIKSAGN